MANVTTSAETNLIGKSQMTKVREIELVNRFTHNSLNKLLEVLGVSRLIPVQEGTTLYVYETAGTLQSGAVPEGEIIPLSQYATTKTPIGEISLQKFRKAVSAEAIAKSGSDNAVDATNDAMIRDVEKGIRSQFFTLLNGTITGSTTASGVGLQQALATAWGVLQVAFEDDTAEAVYFVNPQDLAVYLGSANITMQTAFGMSYIENFLGLGTVVLSSQITQGTFLATAKENIRVYYIGMNGDLANSFNLTSDETGLVGISSADINVTRAQLESLLMTGVKIGIEYAGGVVKGTITSNEAEIETETEPQGEG